MHVFAELSEFTIEKAQWLKYSHFINGFVAVQVMDPDMNLCSNDIEKFKIHISSC